MMPTFDPIFDQVRMLSYSAAGATYVHAVALVETQTSVWNRLAHQSVYCMREMCPLS